MTPPPRSQRVQLHDQLTQTDWGEEERHYSNLMVRMSRLLSKVPSPPLDMPCACITSAWIGVAL